jgi:hypothetical protein
MMAPCFSHDISAEKMKLVDEKTSTCKENSPSKEKPGKTDRQNRMFHATELYHVDCQPSLSIVNDALLGRK